MPHQSLVILVAVVSIIASAACRSAPSTREVEERARVTRRLRDAPRRPFLPVLGADELLSIQMDVPESVDITKLPKVTRAEVVVRIKNVWKWPVALPCDDSPRVLTSIRLESLSFLASYIDAPVTTREMVYDLGDVLCEGKTGTSMYVLDPDEVIEARIDISPIFVFGSVGTDYFFVRAELNAVDCGWVGVAAGRETWLWNHRSIITEDALMGVTVSRK